MSRSRKRTPAGTWCCCKSQKRGKQLSHRKFRRRARVEISREEFSKLPKHQREVMSPWDLGGDGKTYYGFHPEKEWFNKSMRK